jgi:hypothetical protein
MTSAARGEAHPFVRLLSAILDFLKWLWLLITRPRERADPPHPVPDPPAPLPLPPPLPPDSSISIDSSELDFVRLRRFRDSLPEVRALLDRADTAAREASSRFRDRAEEIRERLYPLKRRFHELSAELERFRDQHRLARPSRRPRGRKLALWRAAPFVMIAIESVLNMSFLARGIEGGYLHGFAYAFLISLVNVWCLGFWFAGGLLRQLHHRSLLRKLAAMTGLLIVSLLVYSSNLLFAHLREALGRIPDDEDPKWAFQRALKALYDHRLNPFVLEEATSFWLVLAGLFFSVFAAYDKLKVDDPYPGYGDLCADHDETEARYLSTRQAELTQFAELKDKLLLDLDTYTRDIERRLNEFYDLRAACVDNPSVAAALAAALQGFPEERASQTLEELRDTRRAIFDVYDDARQRLG